MNKRTALPAADTVSTPRAQGERTIRRIEALLASLGYEAGAHKGERCYGSCRRRERGNHELDPRRRTSS